MRRNEVVAFALGVAFAAFCVGLWFAVANVR